MDTKRGRTGESESESPRKRPLESDESPVDPEQTSEGPRPESKHQRPVPPETPGEVENRIRDTRERMSETLNEIEYRISPNHLKHESKKFMHETVDELKREYHPQRIAKNVGTNMKNTVREHPISSIIAGLSISYLLVKSGEEKQRRKRSHEGDPSDRHPRPGDRRKENRQTREEPGPGDQIRDATEKAAEKTEEVKEEATQQAQEMKDQAKEWTEKTGRKAQRKARSARHSMERRTRKVQGQMEDFLFENPFVVGSIALGAGALIGAVLPSTQTEDEWMGEARDDVVEQAGQATEDTMRRASEAAENVAEEAKSAAKDVAETGKEEAERVAAGKEESGDSTKENGNQKAEQKKKPVRQTD